MLEAVNTVLQTSPLVRQQAEQISVADSFAANPERVQRTAPQAPYVSPYIYMDVNFDKAVIQLRNGDTGDVENQYPSEASMQALAQEHVRKARSSAILRAETAPKAESQGATTQTSVQGTQQGSTPTPAPKSAGAPQVAVTAQQQAAFAAAARAGNSNAGSVTLFA